MPRPLEPTLIAFGHALRKGAFIILPPPINGPLSAPKILSFQYNPESITRTRSGAWDVRKNQKLGAPAKPQDTKTQASLRGGGLFVKSETIAMKLVFDATELLLKPNAPKDPPPTNSTDKPKPSSVEEDIKKLGVLPELGALEQMAIAEPPNDPKKGPSADDLKLNAQHPKELILVLGDRYFPVIITSMTITEKRYSPDLVPLRAEVDIQMQILEAGEVKGDNVITAAYRRLVNMRMDHAEVAAVNEGWIFGNRAASGEKEMNAQISTMNDIAKALLQQPPKEGE